MKIILGITFALLSYALSAQHDKVSSYYLIRHSEKAVQETATMAEAGTLKADNPNPELSPEGVERAQRWAGVFQNIRFDAVYSTNYIRTKKTAQPTGSANNLDLTIYDPKNFDFEKFKTETKGKTVLVVGHSNTVPGFVNQLIGTDKYPDIADDNFSNLYIVQIIDGQATSQVLFIK